MNVNFKDQTGAPTDSASAPAATESSDNCNNHRREEPNTPSRKPLQHSAHLNGNKPSALLTEKTRRSILWDLKAGLSEHAIAISHGVRESQVRKVREVHLSLVDRVSAILRVYRGRVIQMRLRAINDIQELEKDTWEEEGAA